MRLSPTCRPAHGDYDPESPRANVPEPFWDFYENVSHLFSILYWVHLVVDFLLLLPSRPVLLEVLAEVLLRNSPAQRSLTRPDLGQFLTVWRAESALCRLLRSAPAQRSLTRPDLGQFLTVWRAESALCRLLRNSPAQRSLTRPDLGQFLTVWRAESALCRLLRNSPAQRSLTRPDLGQF